MQILSADGDPAANIQDNSIDGGFADPESLVTLESHDRSTGTYVYDLDD